MKTYLVFRKPSSGWVAGLKTRQQPLWDEHAVFMDRLYQSGEVTLAGPYADLSRALIVVKAESESAAAAMFDPDPWTTARVLETDGVHEWTVFMGANKI